MNGKQAVLGVCRGENRACLDDTNVVMPISVFLTRVALFAFLIGQVKIPIIQRNMPTSPYPNPAKYSLLCVNNPKQQHLSTFPQVCKVSWHTIVSPVCNFIIGGGAALEQVIQPELTNYVRQAGYVSDPPITICAILQLDRSQMTSQL